MCPLVPSVGRSERVPRAREHLVLRASLHSDTLVQFASLESQRLADFPWHQERKHGALRPQTPLRPIRDLYNKATGAVLFNSSIGDWFRTTVGVRQGCLLSSTLFNIFLERIMTDALEDHEGTVSI